MGFWFLESLFFVSIDLSRPLVTQVYFPTLSFYLKLVEEVSRNLFPLIILSDHSLFILNNLYKYQFELFGLIYIWRSFRSLQFIPFLNIKQGSSIVAFSWCVFNIISW